MSGNRLVSCVTRLSTVRSVKRYGSGSESALSRGKCVGFKLKQYQAVSMDWYLNMEYMKLKYMVAIINETGE